MSGLVGVRRFRNVYCDDCKRARRVQEWFSTCMDCGKEICKEHGFLYGESWYCKPHGERRKKIWEEYELHKIRA